MLKRGGTHLSDWSHFIKWEKQESKQWARKMVRVAGAGNGAGVNENLANPIAKKQWNEWLSTSNDLELLRRQNQECAQRGHELEQTNRRLERDLELAIDEAAILARERREAERNKQQQLMDIADQQGRGLKSSTELLRRAAQRAEEQQKRIAELEEQHRGLLQQKNAIARDLENVSKAYDNVVALFDKRSRAHHELQDEKSQLQASVQQLTEMQAKLTRDLSFCESRADLFFNDMKGLVVVRNKLRADLESCREKCK